MRMEWSQAKRTSSPSIQPVYTYALVLISLAATLGIQGFRYMRVWTPLERHYLPAYLGSQMADVVRDNGSYTLLQVVTRKGSRVALDSDVVPAMSDSGQNVFALTEEAVKHGGLRLEFHRAYYNNAEMHAYLGNLIYRNQNLVDLVRPALWGGLVMFFAGVLPATYLDGKRSVAVRNGKKPRSVELIPVAQLNRTRSSRGMGFVSRLHTMLKRVLGINKKVHAPRNKDNPSASIVAEPLPQKPIRMPATVETDNAPRPGSTRQEPTPPEQNPRQNREPEHALPPTPRRFFEWNNMLTISKPLSAGQARTYHQEEFSNAQENYYSEGERIRGEWHGKLAEKWVLHGGVQEEQFRRLSDGQHPITGEQLVRYQTAREYVDEQGNTVKAMEHRAGWDATFSAPKSVSLTALVGGDERVQEAHRASVGVALDELERYVQARLGGNLPPETTGKWVAARFEHDSARPVNSYAAPQLHTHVVFFNLTETKNGETRPLQPQELYRTQRYATAVYRSELAHRLQELGYGIEHGKSGQPEIKGYSREYLEASSPRRKQIEEHLAKENQRGAGAAQIAAHQTREAKLELSHDEMQRRHKDMALEFGNQPKRVKEQARERAYDVGQDSGEKIAHSTVTFAKERNFERDAVADERALLTDALRRSMGGATLAQVKADFEERIKSGEFVEAQKKGSSPDRVFTTAKMIGYEQDTINTMRAGQDRHPALATFRTRTAIQEAHPHLSETQRRAVEQILASRDQVTALEGVAGAGKTTSLVAIREAAEREEYIVKGLAPTSRAAQKLEEGGIASSTLQLHLDQTAEQDHGRKHLYILDESSLASTRQMNEFLHRLRANDRVLLVGDTRQHQAVEAGRPYQQLQEAGIQTARLDEIMRQKDPLLKEVVEKLSHGQVSEAMERLDADGRVHEIVDRDDRIATIAHEYAKQPEGTLVASPDNQSRMAVNQAIHYAMQDTEQMPHREHRMRVLVARQEITGADRQWAAQYEPGNVVRYAKGSKALGIVTGEYARVEGVDQKQNHVTVERENGQRLSYDPRRLQGVTLYREADREFSEGDRIQFTAPNRDRRVANRELGKIEKIDESGNLQIRLDSGRSIAFNIRENPHLDYGYALTSHSSQGQTADRVLIHVDTEHGGEKLINRRLAYVAVSRSRYDAQIYTNDKTALAERLGRDSSHRSALGSTRPAGQTGPQRTEPVPSFAQERERAIERDR